MKSPFDKPFRGIRSPFGPQSGGVTAPLVGVLSWESDSSDSTPLFGLDYSAANPRVGQVITMQRTQNNFSSFVEASVTITSISPLTLSGDFDFGGAWSDGTYEVRTYDNYSGTPSVGYSNEVAVTIAASSAWTLSVPTASASGVGSVGATTDGNNGTLYAVLTTSATPPSAAQIKAGQDHTSAAAPCAKSVSVSSSGAKTITELYGLVESTTYYAHLMHENAGATASNVVTSSSIATPNNLLTKTELFNDATWTKNNSQITANSTAAPDGTTTADDLNANSTTNSLIRETYVTGISISSGQDCVFSAFVKPSEFTKAYLVLDVTGGGSVRTWFDLSGSGTVLTNQNTAAGIDLVSNGFYRIWARRASTTTTGAVGIALCSNDASQVVTTPAIGDGFEIWGAQLQQASSPTIYCAVA
jgi:hypothetical protein